MDNSNASPIDMYKFKIGDYERLLTEKEKVEQELQVEFGKIVMDTSFKNAEQRQAELAKRLPDLVKRKEEIKIILQVQPYWLDYYKKLVEYDLIFQSKK